MTSAAARLREADRHCARMVRHYENFTVASHLTPKRLRRDLTRVYAYCRSTDDIGDETGDAQVATERLMHWRAQVAALFAGDPAADLVLVALAPTIARHRLQPQPFLDLIDANLRDQTTARYEDWPDLHGYCQLSAAPVGRMVLRLFDVDDPEAQALSDDVCIGLQLANFAQDVSLDAERGRTYLLQRDLRENGTAGAVRAMCERAHMMLQSGRILERMAHGRLRLQLALYRLGGEAIIDAVATRGFDTEHIRPVVSRAARLRILARSLREARVTPEGRGEARVLPPQGTLPRVSPILDPRDPSLRRHPHFTPDSTPVQRG